MFLTQIIDGQVTELALCEACARAKGLFDPQSLTFAEKFFPEELKARMDRLVQELSSAKNIPEKREAGTTADSLTQCPVCQFTLADFRRSGRLGCPDCYSVFSSEFESKETDKTQEVSSDSFDQNAESPALLRKKLEQQLQKAVEKEDYETAARLRDQIKTLH